jgi:hypothetical protein
VATCRYDDCSEAVSGDLAWCILHLDFPKEDDPEFTRIRDEKRLKTKEKIQAGDLNFDGTYIYDIDVSDVSITTHNDAVFKNATIKGRVSFEKTKIDKSVFFEGAKIEKSASFAGAEIGGDVRFEAAEIGGVATFAGVRSQERPCLNERR